MRQLRNRLVEQREQLLDRVARVGHDLGVRELARAAYCNPGHISNLRSGKARPSPELAETLDRHLGAGGTLIAMVARSASGRRLGHGTKSSGPSRAVEALRRKLQELNPSLQREDFALARSFLDNLADTIEPLRHPVVEKVLATFARASDDHYVITSHSGCLICETD